MNRRTFINRSTIAAGIALIAPQWLSKVFGAAKQANHLVLYGDGKTDDTEAMRAWFNKEPVYWPDGTRASTAFKHPDNPLQRENTYRLTSNIYAPNMQLITIDSRG